jgi:hypothetical protein
MTKKDIAQLVDALGDTRAQLAELKDQESDIKAKLIKAGVTPAEGDYYRATVVNSDRTYIDWKEIAAKLKPSRQLVTAHTEVKPVISVRCTARKGVK